MDDQIDPGNAKQRKPYQKPTARQLSQNEARLKLLERARGGDQAAMELLELMFPEEARNLRAGGQKKSA